MGHDVAVNGVWLAAHGAALYERRLPVLPEMRDNTVTIAGTDGVVDFGGDYGPRSVGLTFEITVAGPQFNAAVAFLAQTFNRRRGELAVEFSDMPGKRYRCVYAGTLALGATGSRLIDVELRMNDPWPESPQDTALRRYGEGYSVGQGYFYTDHSFAVTAGSVFTINNAGSNVVKPRIRIYGAFDSVTLIGGGQSLTIAGPNGAADMTEIDNAALTIKRNGANAYSTKSGDWITLEPGGTAFTVTGANVNARIEFAFYYKYLY